MVKEERGTKRQYAGFPGKEIVSEPASLTGQLNKETNKSTEEQENKLG